jgi:hypothetical protein
MFMTWEYARYNNELGFDEGKLPTGREAIASVFRWFPDQVRNDEQIDALKAKETILEMECGT